MVFKRAFSLAAIYRNCPGWLRHQRWSNLISFYSMTRPGLSGVWKNVMVMYNNMVGFSNVTGNMVLTERSTARSLERLALEGDTLSQTKRHWYTSIVWLQTKKKIRKITLPFPAVKQYLWSHFQNNVYLQRTYNWSRINRGLTPQTVRWGSGWQSADLGRPPQWEPGRPHLDK